MWISTFQHRVEVCEQKAVAKEVLVVCEQNHSIESHTKPVHIKKLRQAWNAFARLLDLKPDKAFECPLCGLEPHTVICDGTMIGFRKDFLKITASCIFRSDKG